jgi:hypothetical protein
MTIPESGISRPRGRVNMIEVKLQEFEQLFNTIDPSPFHEKDLDHDLEEFIESWAKEYPLHEPLRLIVHLEKRPPDADPQAIIERAVHNYFAYKTGLNQREFKLLMRDGRLSMMIGLLFLTACLSGAQLASTRHIPGAPVVEASLTIAGWVAMWHPMEIYLYGWWPLRRTGKVFRKLSIMPVEVRYSDFSRA